ncbi:MAG: methyltransferase domain-containing protein [Burkholderiales bacterium]|nr:methyltransferase domain-containing protein [Burkholderiales bacterium]
MQNIRSRSKLKQARVLFENRQLSEAKTVCEQICKADKINAEAWLMLGMTNKELGLVDAAIAALESATKLSPQNAFAQNEKGLLLAHTGRYQKAIDAFKLALGDASDPATVLVNMGVSFGLMGQPELALAALDQAVCKNPQALATHIQRSVLLGMLGRHEEALHAAEQALNLKRYDLEANIRYSEALLGLERYDEALAAYDACLSIAPDHLPTQQRVVEICRKATFDSPSAAHFAILQRAFTWRHVYLQDLASFAASVFKARDGFLNQLETVLSDDSQSCETHLEALREFATEHRLYFEGVLAQSLLEDARLELATTGFRARLLRFLLAHRGAFNAGIPASIELILFGLSRQCFNNEHLWSSTETEEQLLVPLLGEVKAMWNEYSGSVISPALVLRIWMISLYRPLHAVLREKSEDMISEVIASAYLKQIIKIEYTEYWEEQRIKAGIKSLTPIAAGVSAEVRQQYEENPYPRWQSLSPVDSILPAVSLGRLFTDGNIPSCLNQPMQILIAGCGTGRHSIQTARKFQASHITAIDLSLASLAYAARKTTELHIENVEYFQADILALGQLEKRFHIIESIGVLHHLENPLAGWRALASLLMPGGLMHIALYSQIARAKLNFARDYIKQAELGNDAASIRTFRQQVLCAPEGSALAEAALLGRDFYSLSNCRDLLFHVQEHQFTLLQLASSLDELGLDFLAMEADPWTLEAYSRFNPADPRGTDLQSWHQFELKNPLTFAGMYQFWCQKR